MHCYGEGGMLTTSNDEYAKNAVLCRHFGHLPDQFGGEQHVIGYNYTLSGWNAAMGRITPRLLDEWNSQRRRNAEKYSETLKGVQGIETPVEKDWGHHVYLHYVIRAERRDRLKEHLTKKGIETVIHYPIPIPHQKTYRAQFGYKDGMYPLSEEATTRVLSLPTRPTLTDEELQYIVNAIREFYA
jgi:dTDP-4-amino-4,6-dideoxygalactose transaminase